MAWETLEMIAEAVRQMVAFTDSRQTESHSEESEKQTEDAKEKLRNRKQARERGATRKNIIKKETLAEETTIKMRTIEEATTEEINEAVRATYDANAYSELAVSGAKVMCSAASDPDETVSWTSTASQIHINGKEMLTQTGVELVEKFSGCKLTGGACVGSIKMVEEEWQQKKGIGIP